MATRSDLKIGQRVHLQNDLGGGYDQPECVAEIIGFEDGDEEDDG